MNTSRQMWDAFQKSISYDNSMGSYNHYICEYFLKKMKDSGCEIPNKKEFMEEMKSIIEGE